jgi:hypothetical protein
MPTTIFWIILERYKLSSSGFHHRIEKCRRRGSIWNSIGHPSANEMHFCWIFSGYYSGTFFHSTLNPNVIIQSRKLFSFELREADIGQLTSDHAKMSRSRSFRPCWVEWWYLFSFSKLSKVTGPKFIILVHRSCISAIVGVIKLCV